MGSRAEFRWIITGDADDDADDDDDDDDDDDESISYVRPLLQL